MTHDTTERDLGRVEGKLDLVLQRFQAFEERMERRDTERDGKHSTLADRVTALEKKVLAAVLMGGGGIGAYALDVKQLILSLLH